MLSWICLSDHASKKLGVPLSLFQSLLSWICLSDGGVGAGAAPRHSCFNPCCRGSASLTTPPHRSPTRSPSRFQSLLSWICLSDLTLAEWAPVQAWMFQSLLSWICLSDRGRRESTGAASDRFQSLLSWICLSDRTRSFGTISRRSRFNPCCRGSASLTPCSPPPRARIRTGFNPCCRGSASLTERDHAALPGPRNVSILVVVDLPL